MKMWFYILACLCVGVVASITDPPSLWNVLSTTKELKPHKDLWALLPSAPLRTLTHITHANLTIILSKPIAAISIHETNIANNVYLEMQRFVAPIRPRANNPASTLFQSPHGLAYVLGTVLAGEHSSSAELAALGEVNSVLGVITSSWIPLTFARTADNQVVVQGAYGTAGVLGTPLHASNGVVYHSDALPLPAPSVATLTPVTPLHVQLLAALQVFPAAGDTCGPGDDPRLHSDTVSPTLWVAMGLLFADLVFALVLVMNSPVQSADMPALLLPAPTQQQ